MSASNSTHPDAIPMEILEEQWGEYKYGLSKQFAIITSTAAIISVISSCSLIRMIMKSKQRLSTTYHRILLGMSIADILYSSPYTPFQALVPSDISYAVWNAHGNAATCTAFGFISNIGTFSTWFYSCALNIYYLFKVKYSKSDSYIRAKIEPFLHGVPFFIALVFNVIFLDNDNFNSDHGGACTTVAEYQPYHCIGYEDGEIREGFTIPCGRGVNGQFYWLSCVVLMFISPIIVVTTFGMLYRHVTKQEKRMARFGVGDVNRDNSNSRAVLHKTLAYCLAYFASWGWTLVGFLFVVAGAHEQIPMWYNYLWHGFNPLQGLFNLLVYMHPKVVAAKKSCGVALPRAFAIALWAGLTGGGIKKYQDKKKNQIKENVPIESNGRKKDAKIEDNCTSVTDRLSTTRRMSVSDNEEERADIEAPAVMTS